MPDVADLTTWDGAEADIIAWPADRRGRTINWRMTPSYARELAEALEELGMPNCSPFHAEVDGLREAARRSAPKPVRGLPVSRLAEPLPRLPVAGTLRSDHRRHPQ